MLQLLVISVAQAFKGALSNNEKSCFGHLQDHDIEILGKLYYQLKGVRLSKKSSRVGKPYLASKEIRTLIKASK